MALQILATRAEELGAFQSFNTQLQAKKKLEHPTPGEVGRISKFNTQLQAKTNSNT